VIIGTVTILSGRTGEIITSAAFSEVSLFVLQKMPSSWNAHSA